MIYGLKIAFFHFSQKQNQYYSMIANLCQLSATTRNNVLKLIDGLSDEQLNIIPKGFNNNLAWQLGHITVTQQLLCYRLASQASFLSNGIIDKYRKGSRPEEYIDQAEIANLKEWLEFVPSKLEQDYKDGLFQTFKIYPTSYGAKLTCIEDAIVFNNVHESMHLGNMIAMKKLI